MAGSVLLEREPELGRIARALAGSPDVQACLLVEGPAGIGKTELLREAARTARTQGLSTLAASGAELERGLAYAVVRQLYGPVLAALPAADRYGVLSGAAALAAPVVDPLTAPAETSSATASSVMHGLYWLTANLAARRRLLIMVDDSHWADPASLRFLQYLQRRLESLDVVLLLSARPGDPGSEAGVLQRLAAEPDVAVLRPKALTRRAVSRLVAGALDGPADERFVAALHGATGGVPFLVRELLASLLTGGAQPDAEVVAVLESAPPRVAAITRRRVGAAHPQGSALAEAVAVLGSAADLHRASRLADIPPPAAADALDALVAADILVRGPPPAFAHLLLRSAIYGALAPARRSALHGRAAQLLAGEGVEPETIASHWLKTEPGDRLGVARVLRAAGKSAGRRGAPESAAVYLSRAAAETRDPAGRAELLRELAAAEAMMRHPSAVAHLEEALRLTPAGDGRAVLWADLAELLGYMGQWKPAIAAIRSGRAEASGADPETVARLEALWAGAAGNDAALADEFDARLPALEALAARPLRASRQLALLLAGVLASRGADPARIGALVERGLDGGRLLAEEGSEAWALPQALGALILEDELDAAEELAASVRADAVGRGSALGFVSGLGNEAWVQARRGELAGAEAAFRRSIELCLEAGLHFVVPVLFHCAADVLLERPEFGDVAAGVETLEFPPDLIRANAGAAFLQARGRLRLAAGRIAEAEADLRLAGEVLDALEFRNPAWATWRGSLALAVSAADPGEARSLVARQLADARAIDLPRGVGRALYDAALVEQGDERVALLGQAVEVLRSAPLGRLELARALLELGAAERRGGRRSAARELLREALDRAARCGATRTADRAREELVAAGARPRRVHVSGPGALTPSELRVARMAAGGMTNRDIAQALFVTAKTVENQLGRAYVKLGIGGRTALREALDVGEAPKVQGKSPGPSPSRGAASKI